MGEINLKLDGRLRKQVKGYIEKYKFQVGVLSDAEHKRPVSKLKGLKNYAGGPARKVSSFGSGVMISEVSESLRKQTGINFYTAPFQSTKNKEIVAFLKGYGELCKGKLNPKRLENLLQAVVRNPILRGDYGRNTNETARAKGFNRLMIDSAQLFKRITAKVSSNV